MGLKERILRMRAMMHPGMEPDEANREDYANNKLEEAAEVAAESDALMAEMVNVMAGLDPSQLTDDQAINLTGVLGRYNQYKDQTND